MADGLTEESLERIKFSFSSKNAENTVAPCLVQIYVSEDHTGPIVWQQVTSGVVALLRNKESTKKGWIWNISVAIADRYHGMCVWKDKLSTESGYTALSDNFHVFAVSNIQAIVAFVFETAEHGRNFAETYKQWALDKKRDDGSKGKVQPGRRFTRELISRPCNFQHISGSAALAQIQQMEDAKQAVGRAITTIGPRRAVPLDSIDGGDVSGGKRKKKGQSRPDRPSRFENMNLPMPGDNISGLDLAYSQEPSSVRGSTPSVAMPDTIVEQQPVVSNGVHHHQVDHQVSLQQNYQQYPDQNSHQTVQYQHQNVQHQDQAAQYQDQNTQYHNQNTQYHQTLNYNQHDHNHQLQYQNGQYQQQTQYQQDQSQYQPHQQTQPQYQQNQPQSQPLYQDQGQVQEVQYRDRSQRHQSKQQTGATYQVEDIGYDYDDGVVGQSEDVWRESVMEGTNWEDEVFQAISMRTGGSAFVASEYL